MCKRNRLLFYLLILCFALVFSINSPAFAQYWEAIPPYNLLWPLWVPTLSPVDPLSGISTPLVTYIDRYTQLPFMPAWVWNIDLNYPWFLYNAPVSVGGGLAYWDLWTGFNLFPDPLVGGLNPIALPFGFEFLVPNFDNFAVLANQANLQYLAATQGIVDALSLADLLTPSILWGSPPFLLPPAPAPVAPVVPTPITPIAPAPITPITPVPITPIAPVPITPIAPSPIIPSPVTPFAPTLII